MRRNMNNLSKVNVTKKLSKAFGLKQNNVNEWIGKNHTNYNKNPYLDHNQFESFKKPSYPTNQNYKLSKMPYYNKLQNRESIDLMSNKIQYYNTKQYNDSTINQNHNHKNPSDNHLLSHNQNHNQSYNQKNISHNQNYNMHQNIVFSPHHNQSYNNYIDSNNDKKSLVNIHEWLPNINKKNDVMHVNKYFNTFDPNNDVLINKAISMKKVTEIVDEAFNCMDFFSDKGLISRCWNNYKFSSFEADLFLSKTLNKSLSSTFKHIGWREIKEVFGERDMQTIKTTFIKSYESIIKSNLTNFTNFGIGKQKLLFSSHSVITKEHKYLKHVFFDSNTSIAEKTKVLLVQSLTELFAFLAGNASAIKKEFDDGNFINNKEQIEELILQFTASKFASLKGMNYQDRDIDEVLKDKDFIICLKEFQYIDLKHTIYNLSQYNINNPRDKQDNKFNKDLINSKFFNLVKYALFIKETDTYEYNHNPEIGHILDLGNKIICNSLMWNSFSGVRTRDKGWEIKNIAKNAFDNKTELIGAGEDIANLSKSIKNLGTTFEVEKQVSQVSAILDECDQITDHVTHALRIKISDDVSNAAILSKKEFENFFNVIASYDIPVLQHDDADEAYIKVIREKLFYAIENELSQNTNHSVVLKNNVFEQENHQLEKNLFDSFSDNSNALHNNENPVFNPYASPFQSKVPSVFKNNSNNIIKNKNEKPLFDIEFSPIGDGISSHSDHLKLFNNSASDDVGSILSLLQENDHNNQNNYSKQNNKNNRFIYDDNQQEMNEYNDQNYEVDFNEGMLIGDNQQFGMFVNPGGGNNEMNNNDVEIDFLF